MFSSKRGSKTASVVAPEVGASLSPAAALPAGMVQSAGEGSRCSSGSVQGEPPQAVFTAPAREGEATAYLARGSAGSPALAVVNVPGDNVRVEIWEVSADTPPRFVRKRDLALDPQQGTWPSFFTKGVGCLPQDRLVLAVNYFAPLIREALFIYESRSGAVKRLSDAAPDTDDYDKYFELRPAGPDASLLLYYTGRTRTAREVYHNAFNHLLLYSPRHPQGLEVLKLGIDDGNVVQWGVVDRTLWLRTLDRRERGKPVERFWSLDLQRVL